MGEVRTCWFEIEAYRDRFGLLLTGLFFGWDIIIRSEPDMTFWKVFLILIGLVCHMS